LLYFILYRASIRQITSIFFFWLTNHFFYNINVPTLFCNNVINKKGGCMTNSVKVVLVCIMVLLAPSLVFAAKAHQVKKNESLYNIAKKYHVTVNDLKAANHMVSNRIKRGDVLVIPPRSSASVEEARAPKAETYKVKKGDSLARIARKTGLSVKELKRLNSLGKKKLRPGTVLALRENGSGEEQRPRAEKRVVLRNSDLFNKKDYDQSLAELTEPEPDQQVDLNKNVELNTDNINLLKSKAYGFLGIRYRFGGSSTRGIDCSSFVQQVFREMEISLPRTAREQFEVGNEVAPGDLQKGDLVFFRTYAHYPSHVGIYLGNSKMIHASSRDRRVVISTMDTPYYRSRFIGAKRIAKINPDVIKLEDLIAGVEEEAADDASHNDSLNVGLNN
jgi:peptidoglycan endopeptidase LytE